MSFFKKLKDRLTKSSSKLEEGLEAIVEDGGETEDVAQAAPEEPTPDPKPEPTPEPDTPQVPDTPDPTPTPEPDNVPAPEPETPPTPEPEIPPAPEPDLPEPPQTDPQPDTTPTPTPEPLQVPGTSPEEVPSTDAPSEAPQPSDPTPSPLPPEIEMPSPGDLGGDPEPATQKPGLLGRILRRGETKTVVRRVLDDDMLESLEELMIASDMGVDTALRISANIAEGRLGKKMSVEEIKGALSTEIARVMEPVAKPLPLYQKRPQVVLVVGVNGAGKTTTIGKLASQFRAAGKSVVIAAGDTFRAAAVEQLQVWGDRAGVPVLTAPEGSDPASLAFDALTKARDEGADLLMIDTAGRLQNRQDLMEELAKIVRVIKKIDPDAPHNTLLVLDATTGQNALNQVDTFQKLADVSGLVMTKLDGTAKGGVLVALADKFGLPIHAIGVGEQIDDLAPFDPQDFARALTGAAV
ncbi:signal recognition particle-docking protein FtsY [Maritimibacter dapengensis]|uniref:Signal recognition particle receptor FtsY n=1 Tax=Maritimibacter dapengensis TaxID=2836868 RepID=A0ABS6SY66_9RHOB|nr:signal recognition particle-docking protein FtsY [Maritimibacter dapengensis]MBV7377904.1 signal recognition particle-docking protein FtsY [Maritimibacter dapengensis]